MRKDITPIPATMTYRDAMGEETTRPVTFLLKERRGNRDYLHGWCRLYDDARTFRADRIVGLTDVHGSKLDIDYVLGQLVAGDLDDIPDDFWEVDEEDDLDEIATLTKEEEDNWLITKVVEFYWGIGAIHSGITWYFSGFTTAILLFVAYTGFGLLVARWWHRRRANE